MATKRKIIDRHKTDEAMALLALAADKAAGSGHCLTADEMAMLVDGGCEKEDLARFRHHLGNCGKCYEEWLGLKKMQVVGSRRGRIIRLSRFQKYSYIGSALAVAASVVVFLNITPPRYSVDEKPVQEPAPRQQMSEPVLPQIHMEKEEIDSVQGMESGGPLGTQGAADSVQEVRREKRAASKTAIVEEPQVKKKRLPAPAASMSRQAEEKAMSAEVFSNVARDGIRSPSDSAADINSWLALLEAGCNAGRPELEFWSDMHLQGEQILKKQSGSLPEKTAEKMTTILRITEQMKSDSVIRLCRDILTLLAED
jgi:hypothetical protein